MPIYRIAGITGVILCLLAFLLLQLEKIRPRKPLYSWLNLLGSLGIIYSLSFDFNLSAFLMEVSWGIISLIGLWRYFKTSHKLSKKKRDV